MSRTRAEADGEISRIRRLPYGLARTRAAERTADLVQAEGPPESVAYALHALVESYVWGGEVEKSFVPFSALLRWADDHPEHVDEIDRHNLYWSFKWMVGQLSEYPNVPATRIDATLADMERRFALAGLGRNAVAFSAFRWSMVRGAADAERRYTEWVATPRDDFAQCEACEPGARADYLVEVGRTEEAIRLIEAAHGHGAECATEPASMLTVLALAYLDVGRPQDAVVAHRTSLGRMTETHSDMAAARGRVVAFLGRAGDAARLARRVEQEQRLLLEADTPASRLAFLLGVVAGTAVLGAASGATPLRLADVPATTLGELHGWAAHEAGELAGAFDARNGGGRGRDLLAAALATAAWPEPLDLSVLPAGAPTDLDPTPASAAVDLPAVGGDHGERAEEHAELLLAAGDLVGAAAAYAALAQAAQHEGRLAEAGLAWAEAARCAQEANDDDGAHASFARAVAMLGAGEADALLRAAVTRAWAPSAAAVGQAAQVLPEIDHVIAELEVAGDGELGALAERNAARREHELGELLDSRARALATVGRPDEAITAAVQAGERLGAAGAYADAAHAFWLAGRLHDDAERPAEAVWHLESAVEGFALARDRERRASAAGDLMRVLRTLGRDAEADAVAADVAQR